MKFTKELLDAMTVVGAEKLESQLVGIKAAVGDAFNQTNLANAIARAESQSLIDGRVTAAQRYARLVPVDTSTSAVVGTAIVKGFTDAVGMGRSHSGTGGDIPLAELVYSDQSLKVVMGAVAYQYSIAEMQAASRGNVPLSSDKAAAARLAYERHMYKIAMVGEPEKGLKGLLNHDIPESVAAVADWDTASAQSIITDLANAIGVAFDESEMTGDTSGLPNIILLPSAKFRLLSTRTVSATSETSILTYIRENNLLTVNGVDVTIEALPELNTAGAGNTPRAVIYRRDPSALELILPQDLEFVAPQAKDLDIYVPGHYLYAGLWIKSAKAVIYLDGL